MAELKYKRFLVFSGVVYYPSGGFGDFKKDFDSLESAKEYAIKYAEEWWEIVDLETKEYWNGEKS